MGPRSWGLGMGGEDRGHMPLNSHDGMRRINGDAIQLVPRNLATMLRQPPGFIVPAQPIERDKPPAGPDWVHEIKHDGSAWEPMRAGSGSYVSSSIAFGRSARSARNSPRLRVSRHY
jgi:hypothetical protein